MCPAKREGLLSNAWEETQIKVFGRWVAKNLAQRGIKFEDIKTEFADGVKLIQLLEIIGKEQIKYKWHPEPGTNRFKRLENANVAIKYVSEDRGIKLVGIHAEEIVDTNLKLTLGLTWSCINKFVIDEISVEEATARDALLMWCRKNTQGYENVDIKNFSKSWVDGNGFAALLNHFRPNLIDYASCNPTSTDKASHLETCRKAFAGFTELGIVNLLDPEDVVGPIDDPAFAPDDKAMVTEISELYNFFAADSKQQNQADKLKKIVAIQKQIEQFSDDYAKQAQATIDAITAADAKLTAQDYAKTVLGARSKLASVIAYGRDERPNIVLLRATALRTWGALVTKANSAGRVIPPPPAGLEPETLNSRFDNVEKTQAARSKELTDEVHALETALIGQFDEKAGAIAGKCVEIKGRSDSLSGSLADQLTALQGLLEEATPLTGQTDALEAPNKELVDLGLETRSKYSLFSVRQDVETLLAHLKHLIEQNKGEQFAAANKARIDAYNAKALPYLEEAEAFDASVSAVAGSLVERRTALIAKQEECTAKREAAQVLLPDFGDLEKDGLHLDIANTPGKINGIYGGTLNRIVVDLNKIYDEMVLNFDNLTTAIIAKFKVIQAAVDGAAGSPTEIRDVYAKGVSDVEAIDPEIDPLFPAFDELTEFKLNFRVKFTASDVKSEFVLLVSHAKHLLQAKEGEIALAERNRRIQEFKDLVAGYVTKEAELEAAVQGVNEGGASLPEKRTAYEGQSHTVGAFKESLNALVEPYNALERDQLHLEIDHTPASLTAAVGNLEQTIQTLIGEVDSAIAREKGLQISDEQLSEFRDTFQHFDKDGNHLLEPFQLNACLTALGEPSTVDECKAIVGKFSPGKTGIDFDGYVKFMLDRFSKAETKDTTKSAFSALTSGQPTITDEQIDRWFPEDGAYLKEKIPKGDDGTYAYQDYVASIFTPDA
jgi:actinin alpha